VLRSQAGIGFIWQGKPSLRNWRATRGSRGRMLTGFDEERGAVRSFYREDIERYLDINFNETRRNTTKADPMFRRLRTARFLKARATLTAQWVFRRGCAYRPRPSVRPARQSQRQRRNGDLSPPRAAGPE
jgi:hypothetical protein